MYPQLANVLAAWNFDDQAEDQAGSNDFMLVGASSYAPGKINNGLDLENGSTQYATVAAFDGLVSQTKVSISFWFKPETLAEFTSLLAWGVSSTSQCFHVALGGVGQGGSDDLRVRVATGDATSLGVTNANLIAAGVWTHAVIVYDGDGATNADRLKIYLNGTERTIAFDSTIPAATSAVTGMPFQVGRFGTLSGSMYDGMADEVVIWAGAALSPDDATTLYNSGDGLTYPFGVFNPTLQIGFSPSLQVGFSPSNIAQLKRLGLI